MNMMMLQRQQEHDDKLEEKKFKRELEVKQFEHNLEKERKEELREKRAEQQNQQFQQLTSL